MKKKKKNKKKNKKNNKNRKQINKNKNELSQQIYRIHKVKTKKCWKAQRVKVITQRLPD